MKEFTQFPDLPDGQKKTKRRVAFTFDERSIIRCTCSQGNSARVMPWNHDANCPIYQKFEAKDKLDWVTPEIAENLIQYVSGSAAVKKLSNRELAELILNHLWAHLPLSNAVSWVLDEAINRLAPELADEPDEPLVAQDGGEGEGRK